MQKCKHFKIYELVDPITYEKFGQKSWEFLDPNALITLDLLRETFGPAVVNDWKWGGKYQWSGLRPFHCKKYAKYSQHRFGRAFDVKFNRFTAQEIRTAIKSDLEYWSEHISRIEKKVSWFHFDLANCAGIKFINP